MTTEYQIIETCGCERCFAHRQNTLPKDAPWQDRFLGHGFRYACELCGNKRCPHHTDHTLECTRSNEPGQKGSSWGHYPIAKECAKEATN